MRWFSSRFSTWSAASHIQQLLEQIEELSNAVGSEQKRRRTARVRGLKRDVDRALRSPTTPHSRFNSQTFVDDDGAVLDRSDEVMSLPSSSDDDDYSPLQNVPEAATQALRRRPAGVRHSMGAALRG